MPDEVIAKSERVLCPEGTYRAVCVDVIDLGEVHNERWAKLERKVAIVFQVDCPNPKNNGNLFEINQRFTISMSPKSRLRPFLADWRGRSYKDAEAAKGVKLSGLVGYCAMITVEHNDGYANIFKIAPLGKGEKKMLALGYERAPWWSEKQGQRAAEATVPPAGKPKQAPEESYDEAEDSDFPAALHDEDDNLPF